MKKGGQATGCGQFFIAFQCYDTVGRVSGNTFIRPIKNPMALVPQNICSRTNGGINQWELANALHIVFSDLKALCGSRGCK